MVWWIVELGRGDLEIEVSTMASMIALPREGHLSAVFQMFSFLKRKHNGVTVFDPAKPEIDQPQFPTEDWSTTTYGPCKEDAPSKAPAPGGAGFTTRFFLLLSACSKLSPYLRDHSPSHQITWHHE